MKYVYTCANEERCKIADLPQEFFEGKLDDLYVDVDSRLNVYTDDGKIDIQKSPLVWFVSHAMEDDPEIKCPVCDANARKVIQRVTSYFRGNCYLDVEGCKRDMNIYQLQKNDPYGHMRQPGEKDELISKLKRGNKPKPQYYRMPSKSPKN